MQVPPELNYNQLQTKAFFSVYKSWPIEPISNGGQYWPGEVIRIWTNSLTDGVFDPYRSHLEITVESDSETLPVGLLQVDNSAQSFIQQIVISSNNREIERIVEYSVLAAYLTDIGISEIYSEGKETEGLGYSNMDNYSSIYNTTYASSSCGQYSNFPLGGEIKTMNASGNVFPTIPMKSSNACMYGQESQAPSILSGLFRSHMSWLNTAWLNETPNPWWWYIYCSGDVSSPACNDYPRLNNLQFYGYNNNIRSEYLASYGMNDYIDTSFSLTKSEVRLDENVQNGEFPAKFSNGTVYNTFIPETLPFYFNDDDNGGNGGGVAYQIPNVASLHGYSNLFSPNFAKGVREPFISPTVPQCQMANGVIIPQKVPVSQRTFKIPLISSILGLLIPEHQFVLLPLRALNNILIELTIDPNAMFTSGYNDISEFDNIGMGLMQQRAFKVTRLVYNLHTYQFYNPEMDEYLRVSLSTGIAINTKFWQLGNQYQIENSQSLTNSWPVACNEEALNEILVLFVPLDYQNLSFCRKHFRLSNNITKLQLRINMEYYPSQPLTGNGGNPIEIDATGNNSVFLEQIYQAHGFMFSKKPPPRINAFNFAINERCYNVFNTHSLYDPAMIDNNQYVWTSDSVNYDTALGMSNIHENRYVGKAAYVFSFEPYTHSKNFLCGIDCRAAKAFDILFTCNPENWFPRPQTMYIFTGSSVIIEYGKDGIVNINK